MLRSDDRGIVALVSTILIGFLLILVVGATLMVVTDEHRRAIDLDLSNRAFAVAESGVEDALAEIQRAIDLGDPLPESGSCGAAYSPGVDFGDDGAEVVCRLITPTSTGTEVSLSPEEVYQFDVVTEDLDSIVLEWNLESSIPSPTRDPQLTGPVNIPNFPVLPIWQSNWPAVMEVTVISYPKSGTISSSGLIQRHRKIILKPSDSLAPTPVNFATAAFNPTSASFNPIRDSVCTPDLGDGRFNCNSTITGFDTGNNAYIVRVKPRYARAHVLLNAELGGTPVSINDNVVTIDVTGRVTDAYRRVISRVEVRQEGSSPVSLNILDNVILTDEDMCKNLSIELRFFNPSGCIN